MRLRVHKQSLRDARIPGRIVGACKRHQLECNVPVCNGEHIVGEGLNFAAARQAVPVDPDWLARAQILHCQPVKPQAVSVMCTGGCLHMLCSRCLGSRTDLCTRLVAVLCQMIWLLQHGCMSSKLKRSMNRPGPWGAAAAPCFYKQCNAALKLSRKCVTWQRVHACPHAPSPAAQYVRGCWHAL